ncbi:HlyC/CorC family transporter [Microbaculum marinisediminis]|uniref:HlyC/CorC family transporter n=1 Tax=Microbaculum marinisediminis TaxID=2931392 RepID=A0AAW5QU92_9HYPH|nr:HlyC/CorC family transporter [Microbaculum sp. A6E488]MCT8971462.1 HlyC/CorC family transporter [Microbaculum sp. A6E488]
MTLAIAIIIGAIVGLIISSGFFSGSETALTAASRARMHQLEKTGDRRASTVNRLLETRERLIGALLLGNNLVNILASAMATSVAIQLFGDAGVVYATVVMTALVVVFAEVLPKTYAILHPDRVALFVSPGVRVIVWVFGPVTMAIEFLVRGIMRAFGSNIADTQPLLSAHEELRGAIDLHHREGAVIAEDRYMLGGILDLRDLEVSDVMVHRTEMRMLNGDEPPEKVVQEVLASPHTRMPMWKGSPENIVGVLHAKDLLRALAAENADASKIDIDAILNPPWFVPDVTTLQDQLNAFLKRKAHFALVVDEYGEVMGLVTLEDILEEIVGDIADEHDIVVEGVRPQPDGSVAVDGSVPIRDLNRAMDWNLPDDEATTIAGLVIHEARQIPEPSQAFTFHGFRFQVLRKAGNRLTKLRITPVTKPKTSRKEQPQKPAEGGGQD